LDELLVGLFLLLNFFEDILSPLAVLNEDELPLGLSVLLLLPPLIVPFFLSLFVLPDP